MDITTLLLWLIVGGIAGWIAGNVINGEDFGLIGNVSVGIVGAMLGGFLFGMSSGSVTSGNILGSLLVATTGSLLLLFLARLVRQNV